MRELVFDTETTGLDPKEDRIFEIGIVETENRLPTGRTRYYLLDPQRPLSEASTRITGFTDQDVAGKPKLADVIDDILDFIGTDILVAHNASFDMGFMQAEMERHNKPPLQNPVIDTLELAREKLPGSRHSLDALCKRYSIDLSERTVHGALLDASLLVDVYIELHGGLQGNILDSLEEEERLNMEEALQNRQNKQHNRTPLLVTATPEEAEAHTAFLNKYMPENNPWS